MIPQPGHPRNVPEALTGPEDKKNSFGAKKEKAGEIPVIIQGRAAFGKMSRERQGPTDLCGPQRARERRAGATSRNEDKKIPEGPGPSGK